MVILIDLPPMFYDHHPAAPIPKVKDCDADLPNTGNSYINATSTRECTFRTGFAAE